MINTFQIVTDKLMSLPWQFALAVLILINVSSVSLSKRAADKMEGKTAVGVFFQYGLCAMIASVIFAIKGGILDAGAVVIIGMVGAINAFGNYAQWRASALSLSRTSLFFPLSGATAIVMAAFFLKEYSMWSASLIVGMILCLAALFSFRITTAIPAKDEKITAKWMFFVLAMVLVFGTASFLMKYFSLSIPTEQFLLGWYGGAFMGSAIVVGIGKKNVEISANEAMVIAPVSVAIMGALAALYWTYQLGGAVSQVVPLQQIGIATIPVAIGMFVFGEKKKFSKMQIFSYLIALTGVILILLPK